MRLGELSVKSALHAASARTQRTCMHVKDACHVLSVRVGGGVSAPSLSALSLSAPSLSALFSQLFGRAASMHLLLVCIRICSRPKGGCPLTCAEQQSVCNIYISTHCAHMS
jgi:hypothetical protein